MVTIAEKINTVLSQRGMLKRDLARALDIAPQTATDICKGRSAVTIKHLRRLVDVFGLRADYWLDESRLEPVGSDEVQAGFEGKIQGLVGSGLLRLEDPAGLFSRLLELAQEHRAEFLRRFGTPRADEAHLLGLPAEVDRGSSGRIGDAVADD
ncbi:MAG: transcriptional regulator [Planctomycetota bacterium]